MEDYNACKMYIIFDDNWDCYIGHTIQTLKRRLGIHLSADKTVSTMINPEIFLLEDYPCNNLLEARIREQCWMDTFPKAINKYRAYTSKEMRKEQIKEDNRRTYLKNKEKIRIDSRLYNLKNKEKIKLKYENTKEKRLEYQRLYRLKQKELTNKIDTLIPPSE